MKSSEEEKSSSRNPSADTPSATLAPPALTDAEEEEKDQRLSLAIPPRNGELPLYALNAPSARLFKSLRRRSLLPLHLLRAAFATPADYKTPTDLCPLIDAIMTADKVGWP